MLQIALYQPEIPPNTGNIIRLCANMGATLHLIHPLGFNLEDKKMRRAGLDYQEWASINHHDSFADFTNKVTGQRIFACSTKATKHYTQVQFQTDDILLFGPETRGLPETILNDLPQDQVIKIPMQPQSRSINLANAVAIISFEAWRQLDFIGAKNVEDPTSE